MGKCNVLKQEVELVVPGKKVNKSKSSSETRPFIINHQKTQFIISKYKTCTFRYVFSMYIQVSQP